MGDWVSLLENSDYGPSFLGGVDTIIFIMLMAFAVGHLIGFVYMWTHEAISYSRTFVASLAVLPVLIAIMMVVMAGNVLIAFGLIAVFGVIRFRNVLKDTRDTTFILWSIVEGLTIGTMRYSTAALAALGVSFVYLYLRLTSFGTRHRYDAVLTLKMVGEQAVVGAQLKQILKRHATNTTLMNERRANDQGIDVTYRLLLRNPNRVDELQSALATAEGLTNVTVFMHEDEAEI